MISNEEFTKQKSEFLSHLKGLECFKVKIVYTIGRTQIVLNWDEATDNAEYDGEYEHLIDYNDEDPYAFIPFDKHIITEGMASPGMHTYLEFNEKDIASIEKSFITDKDRFITTEVFKVGMRDNGAVNYFTFHFPYDGIGISISSDDYNKFFDN